MLFINFGKLNVVSSDKFGILIYFGISLNSCIIVNCVYFYIYSPRDEVDFILEEMKNVYSTYSFLV